MRVLAALTFHADDPAALAALLPQEQEHVRMLREEGALDAIYISADRAKVWLIFHVASVDEAQRLLTDFPLYPYMRVEWTPLLG